MEHGHRIVIYTLQVGKFQLVDNYIKLIGNNL